MKNKKNAPKIRRGRTKSREDQRQKECLSQQRLGICSDGFSV
jgi:hypothetical protein